MVAARAEACATARFARCDVTDPVAVDALLGYLNQVAGDLQTARRRLQEVEGCIRKPVAIVGRDRPVHAGRVH